MFRFLSKFNLLRDHHFDDMDPLRYVVSISVVIGIFSLILITGVIQAQSSAQPLVIPKLKGSIKLDGRSVESAWEHAKELSLVQ